MKDFSFQVDEAIRVPVRVDKLLAESSGIATRSQLKQRLSSLRVNGREARLSAKIRAGDWVEGALLDPPASTLVPQNIPLSVLYEDESVLVVDKPAGMVVHPGNGVPDGTLANALAYHVAALSSSFGDNALRPGIVHRLDRDTSGVIICAKHPEALAMLSAQFKDKSTRKTYLALVKGVPRPGSGIIDNHLARDPKHRTRFAVTKSGGKRAITRYRVLRVFGAFALVMLRLYTGRTHQLRVHLRHLGHPIAGDCIYGARNDVTPRLMLHAWRLRIRLPGNREQSRFSSPIPADFRKVLSELVRSNRG